jgi:hypothetical protein
LQCSLLHLSSWDFWILVPSLGFFICHRWNSLTGGILPHLQIFFCSIGFCIVTGSLLGRYFTN